MAIIENPNLYFKNITLINPNGNVNEKTNVWIKDGAIRHISPEEAKVDPETDIYEADGWVCSPGLYDPHVHFREPGFEYKEDIRSGAEAAANGGFTGVCLMPNTEPPIDDATTVNYIRQKSAGALVDMDIAAAITKKREGKFLTPMLELHDNGVVMFTDDGSSVMNSEVMKRAFDYASTRDLLIAQHCEDVALTDGFAMNEGYVSGKLGLKGYPSVAEEIIVARDIKLAEYCGNRRYHIQHVSSKGSIHLIRDAKLRGLRVTCEVAPHHFALTEEKIETFSPNYKMNPPLRTKEDVEAILEALQDGAIDCVASDHAPHASHEKDVEFERAPNGVIGLETSLGAALTFLYHKKILTLSEIIEKMSVRPREILGLPKIKTQVGEKANLTVFDPDAEWVVEIEKFKSKAKNSPFIGIELKGKPIFAINNNQAYKSAL